MKYLNIAITVAIFLVLSVPIHEWGHFWACKLLGGEANITFDSIAQGWCHITELPDTGMWVVRLAGGMTVFIVYVILWLLARWTPTRWDLDDELATVIVGSSHFVYSIFEAFARSMIGDWQMIIALILTQAIIFAFYANTLKLHFMEGKYESR